MVTVFQMTNFYISKERLTAVTNNPKVSGAHHYKDLLLTPVIVQRGLLAKELSSTESLGDPGSSVLCPSICVGLRLPGLVQPVSGDKLCGGEGGSLFWARPGPGMHHFCPQPSGQNSATHYKLA